MLHGFQDFWYIDCHFSITIFHHIALKYLQNPHSFPDHKKAIAGWHHQ
jgi:hypothetical protein